MLKEKSPDGVGDSGEGGEIDEDACGAEIGNYHLAAEDYAHKDHKYSADDELISADEDGLLVFGEELHENRGECKRDGGEDNEAVAEEVECQFKAVKVNDNDACKAEYASDDLSCRKLLLPENKASDKHAEECGRAAEDSAFNARGIGESNVEEKILDNRLECADC